MKWTALVAALALLLGIGTTPAQAAATSQPLPSVQVPAVDIDSLPDVELIVPGIETEDGITAPVDADLPITAPTADGKEVSVGLPVTDAAASVTQGGSALYAAEGSPVEVTVQALDTSNNSEVAASVRTTLTILDATSPTSFTFPIDLPAGTALERQEDGTVVAVSSNGQAIGSFAAPWAVDATGKEIPTRYEVRNGSLIQHVDHTAAAYPVVADPVWLVPVAVVGTRVILQITVRAISKQAAKKAASKAAQKTAQAKGKRTASKNPKALKYRSHTQKNLRHNLVVKTGKNPGKRCQAHHTMPVKFESKFKRAGLNIHDPKYARWWISKKGVKNNHQSLAHEYNKRWEAFFKRNPSASKSQILEYRKKIDNSYRKRNVFRC